MPSAATVRNGTPQSYRSLARSVRGLAGARAIADEGEEGLPAGATKESSSFTPSHWTIASTLLCGNSDDHQNARSTQCATIQTNLVDSWACAFQVLLAGGITRAPSMRDISHRVGCNGLGATNCGNIGFSRCVQR
eukprot:740702-Amphidinium_carterae.1